MEKLILIRHGSIDKEGNLSEQGREEMILLGKKLQKLFTKKEVILATSTAPRAIQSADILAEFLEIDIEKHDFLWADNTHRKDFPKTLEFIRSKKSSYAEILIIVTHLPYVEEFPDYFGAEELSGTIFQSFEVKKSEGLCIDILSRMLIKLS